MKNNETDEFELVLGNRQLLGGFFVVALLFGVAFAMGYIVGRNSMPSSKVQAAASSATSQPAAAERASEPPAEAAPETPPASAAAPQSQASQPAPDVPAQSAAQPAPDAAAAAPSEEPDAAATGDADTGAYWQVSAVAESTADIFAKALKDKGFPVTLSPGPRNLVRVLVGPYPDTQSLGRAKSELENAGFHPILLKK